MKSTVPSLPCGRAFQRPPPLYKFLDCTAVLPHGPTGETFDRQIPLRTPARSSSWEPIALFLRRVT